MPPSFFGWEGARVKVKVKFMEAVEGGGDLPDSYESMGKSKIALKVCAENLRNF